MPEGFAVAAVVEPEEVGRAVGGRIRESESPFSRDGVNESRLPVSGTAPGYRRNCNAKRQKHKTRK